MSTSPTDQFADAIADRVWVRLQQHIAGKEQIALLGIPEAAARLGIRKTKMHTMIASGEIPARMVRRIGRRVLIVAAELDRWLKAQ